MNHNFNFQTQTQTQQYGQQYGQYQYQQTGTTYQSNNQYEMTELQVRLLKAKQANLLYKQTLVKNILLNKQVESQNQQQQAQNQPQPPRQGYLPANYQPYQSQPRKLADQLDLDMGLPDLDFLNPKNDVFQNDDQMNKFISQNKTPKPSEVRQANATDNSRNKSTNKGDNNSNQTKTDRQAEKNEKKSKNANQDAVKDSNKQESQPLTSSPQKDSSVSNPNSPRDALSVAAKKRLMELNDNIEKVVEENKETLEKKAFNTAEKEKDEKRVKNEENKKRFENLIKKNESNPIRFPLWKHRLLQNNKYYNPPADTILKGKSLWRAITISIIVLYIKPVVSVRRIKARLKDKHKGELNRALLIYAETVDDWLGKLVQLPIASIVQDATLDFDPKDQFVGSKAAPFKSRMLQLKVRFAAIVRNITGSDLPNEHITHFLTTLISDNNYFPDSFLYPFETTQLDFNALGSTRNMLLEENVGDTIKYNEKNSASNFDTLTIEYKTHTSGSSADSSQNASTKRKSSSANVSGEVKSTNGSSMTGGTVTKTVNVGRIRMVLMNYIFIRILINHLILSPWHHKIVSSAPSGRTAKRVTYNCRVLATVVYSLLQTLNSRVPDISKPAAVVVGKRTADNSSHQMEENKEASKGTGESEPDVEGGPQSMKIQPEVKMNTLSGLFQTLLDKTPAGAHDKVHSGSIEELLLNRRATYGTLDDLHILLLNPSQLTAVKNMVDEWVEEFKGAVVTWTNKLIVHVLKVKFENQQSNVQLKKR